ncbi:MAG TPA: AraC family transcriptional regulator [Cyclobacteriaceae bacterium]|nr:AraC family transcriptional regulator [Cytophagales bacterium]HRF35456.1 AraC family transcriptional regulator [Cyclobacteriaceae bacterium]
MPIIRDILFGAANRGARLSVLCHAIGIVPEELNDSEKYLDFDRAILSWQVAVKETKDPLLGLHLGEQTNPSILGLIGHLMQNCHTVFASFQSVSRYSELATDMFFYRWRQVKADIILSFEPNELWLHSSEKTARQATEQAMSGTMNVFKQLAGKSILPKRVAFAFPKPTSRKEYERIFQCNVEFNAKANQLVFDEAAIQVTVVSYDRSLHALFSQLIQDRFESTRKRKTNFADQVRALLMKEFRTQIPSLEVVASLMNMTPRTFQRMLSENDTTYRKLSTQLQKDVAIHLIKNSKSKVVEIASIMGYADARSFRRAFKMWTDKLPSEVKQKR